MLSFEEFSEQAADHNVVPVFKRIFSGSETPVGIFQKLTGGKPGSFLLESAEQGVWSRFSFIGIGNLGEIRVREGKASWYSESSRPPLSDPALDISEHSGLDLLDAVQQSWRVSKNDDLPPLVSGMVGFLGWNTVGEIENIQLEKPSGYLCPDMAFSLIEDLVVVDHRDSTLILISNAYLHKGTEPREQYERAVQSIARIEEKLSGHENPFLAEVDFLGPSEVEAAASAEKFLESVRKAKEHVVAGDVFQVVISQRFDIPVTCEALDVYRILRAINPSPYMYLLNFADEQGEYSIVGSSPEALVRVDSGKAVLHPIAGSRPRGENQEQDVRFGQELLADQKERAEHLMLVDLARNDLLKVCNSSSVRVSEFMAVERYSHVMHLVSTVEGDLLSDASAIDVVRATFPAGTLSGAPKPRALEIIADLEPFGRGIFGGVVGYFDFAGNADLAIAIRTAFIRDGVARVQAGAGIVLDSDPETERRETISKASAPIRAVLAAEKMKRL